MKIKPYILPASIAAALHSALLLMFPESPAPFPPAPPPPSEPPAQVMTIDLPPIPPDEQTSDEPVSSAALGSQPPVIPDSPPAPKPVEFTFEAKQVLYHFDHTAQIGPPGLPDGVSHGNGDTRSRPFLPVTALDRMPRPTVQVPPDYPSSMRQACINGEVTIEFAVDASGRVVQAQVVKSSRREFEEPTLRAVLKWRFEPGKRGGRAVPFRMVIPVDFAVGGI